VRGDARLESDRGGAWLGIRQLIGPGPNGVATRHSSSQVIWYVLSSRSIGSITSSPSRPVQWQPQPVPLLACPVLLITDYRLLVTGLWKMQRMPFLDLGRSNSGQRSASSLPHSFIFAAGSNSADRCLTGSMAGASLPF
jgi:hypothetical protein